MEFLMETATIEEASAAAQKLLARLETTHTGVSIGVGILGSEYCLEVFLWTGQDDTDVPKLFEGFQVLTTPVGAAEAF